MEPHESTASAHNRGVMRYELVWRLAAARGSRCRHSGVALAKFRDTSLPEAETESRSTNLRLCPVRDVRRQVPWRPAVYAVRCTAFCRNWWTKAIAMLPSPTAAAT